MIMKRAEKEFEPQIKKAAAEQQGALADKLNPNAYLDKVKNIVPKDSVGGITKSATEKFESAIKLANGSGVPGIGSFF